MLTVEILTIITVCATVVSTVLAGYAIVYNKKLKDIDLSHDHYEDVKEWYEQTLLVLKELYVLHPNNNKIAEKNLCIVKLSERIDSSRLYFPNVDNGIFFQEKPEIFRGRRVVILDLLVLYYDIFNKGIQEDNQAILRSIQRAFCSELVSYLKRNYLKQKTMPYTFLDKSNVLDIKNIDDENLRRILVKEDIIKHIQKMNDGEI